MSVNPPCHIRIVMPCRFLAIAVPTISQWSTSFTEHPNRSEESFFNDSTGNYRLEIPLSFLMHLFPSSLDLIFHIDHPQKEIPTQTSGGLTFIFCVLSYLRWTCLGIVVLKRGADDEQSLEECGAFCLIFWAEEKILLFVTSLSKSYFVLYVTSPCLQSEEVLPQVWIIYMIVIISKVVCQWGNAKDIWKLFWAP